METLTVIVSFAVVVSSSVVLERRTPEFAAPVPPINTQASRIVLFHTSADPKNLSRYTTLFVAVIC